MVTNANCASIMAVMALAPLHEAFGVRRLFVATMQAVSGAAIGVPSLDILGNVIPTSAVRKEDRDRDSEDAQAPHGDASSTRRPSARTRIASRWKRTGLSVVSRGTWRRGRPRGLGEPRRRLPTAPEHPIVVHAAQDRPQPRLDVAFGGGMPVHCGRVRRCPVLGYKLVAMGHNTVRGAAGASVLNAELLVATGQAGLA